MARFTQRLTPEARLGYLLFVGAVAIGATSAPVIGALALVQVVLWCADGLGARPLARTMARLGVFVAVIGLSYAFVPLEEPGRDHWVPVTLVKWTVEINLAGLGEAVVMSLRVVALVLASAWVRQSGQPGDLIAGLRRFRVPVFLAVAIDGTLRLAADGGVRPRGAGRGQGGGGGGGKAAGEGSLDVAAMRSGRLGFVDRMIDRWLERAEGALAGAAGLAAGQARDVAVIVGLSAAIMALKLVQVLPGLPFASGHKNVLVVPFLLLAAGLTRMRFGGLWTGITAGTVSVLMGYGKFGVLEIAHFAAPGLLADLLLPLARLDAARWLRLVQFAVIGAVLGLGRFAANLLVIVIAGAPSVAFLLFLPMLASQVAFGALSALVSMVVLERLRRATMPTESRRDANEPG
ncbi:MAG: hypothetical protein WD673_09615 [Alphaproteobacteria bacterium]